MIAITSKDHQVRSPIINQNIKSLSNLILSLDSELAYNQVSQVSYTRDVPLVRALSWCPEEHLSASHTGKMANSIRMHSKQAWNLGHVFTFHVCLAGSGDSIIFQINRGDLYVPFGSKEKFRVIPSPTCPVTMELSIYTFHHQIDHINYALETKCREKQNLFTFHSTISILK